ncbi:MAG: 4Fe-4S dicluster domain-containing protein [Clostridia bacterium]
MEFNSLHSVFFSPTGNSRNVAGKIIPTFGLPVTEYDLMKSRLTQPISFGKSDLLVVSLPVFEGRVPKICLESLHSLKGQATPAIAIVTYGNRNYDDALLELTDILAANGFIPFAAAAFVAEHSILHRLGRKRPDADDLLEITDFAEKCKTKISKSDTDTLTPVTVKGEHPYRTIPVEFSLVPTGDESCTSCQLCTAVCPTGAISSDNPQLTNASLCATCFACASVCPVRCRQPRDPRLPEVLGFLLDFVEVHSSNEIFI